MFPKDVFLVTALRKNEDIASMLFVRHGRAATYLCGWNGAEGRALSAHNLTLWHAAEQLANVGVATIDLGTLDTERAPGLARFKLGSGAIPRRQGSTWIKWATL